MTIRQLVAARKLVRGKSIEKTARLVGTTPRTIRRWQILPEFRAEVMRLHDLLVMANAPRLSQPRAAGEPAARPGVQPGARTGAHPPVAPRGAGANEQAEAEQREVDEMFTRLVGHPPRWRNR